VINEDSASSQWEGQRRRFKEEDGEGEDVNMQEDQYDQQDLFEVGGEHTQSDSDQFPIEYDEYGNEIIYLLDQAEDDDGV
jgi:hypothetical protein